MVDQVVALGRYGFLLAYKGCKSSRHSQICVIDIAKDLAMKEQEVGASQKLVNGHESETF